MRGRNNQAMLDSIADAASSQSVSVGAVPQPMQVHPTAFGGQGQPVAQQPQQQGQMPVQQVQFYPYLQPVYEAQSSGSDEMLLIERLPLLVRLARRARGIAMLTASLKNELAAQAAIGVTGEDNGSRYEMARAFAREWLRQNVR